MIQELQNSAARVFMCSGQGSQKLGMGLDLMEIPEVAKSFECASDVFGQDMKAIVAGETGNLNDTRNAQAAICALSVGIGRALADRGYEPDYILGFSLGQISALALSDMVSDEVAFEIVSVRSKLMAEAAQATPGAMSAFLKADLDSVENVCEECANGEVLVQANFNCPGQIVVSGATGAVARAEEAWSSAGKRYSRLATSGAFHSPLMQSAVEPFGEYLASVDFAEPRVPVICNVDARPLEVKDVREHLAMHLTHPVMFQQSVEYLASIGAKNFVEVGFGGVLEGLVRRIDKTLERKCVQNASSFMEFVV